MWGCLTECSLPPSCSQLACERPDTLPATVIDTLATIQSRMLQTARDNVAANTHEVESYAIMKAALADAEERLQGAPALSNMIELRTSNSAEARKEATLLLRSLALNDGFGAAELRAAGVSAAACADAIASKT